MAYEMIEKALIMPMESESSITEAFVVVTFGTGENTVKLPAAVGNLPVGVVQSKANSGDSVPVLVDRGVTKVVANGAFSKGDPLTIAATTGRVDTGVPGTDPIVGIALEAATAAGQIVSMLFHRELA